MKRTEFTQNTELWTYAPGHGIESVYGLSELLHGECVAIGMIPMLEDEALKERVLRIYEKLGLKKRCGL